MNDDEKLDWLFAEERRQKPATRLQKHGLRRLTRALVAGQVPLAVSAAPLKFAWFSGMLAAGKWTTIAIVSAASIAGGMTGWVAMAPAQSPAGAALSPAQSHTQLTKPGKLSRGPRAAQTELAAPIEPPAELYLPPPTQRAQSADAPRKTTASSAEAKREPIQNESSDADAGELHAELDLMRRTKLAIDAGKILQARSLLAEHRRRFKLGALVVEREGLDAWCACSLNPQQNSAGARFVQNYPGSPLSERVQRVCHLKTLAK